MFGVQPAAWKRLQVFFNSGKTAGIIKGFGWPYDSVRCWWLVTVNVLLEYLSFVNAGGSSMSQTAGMMYHHSFFQNLSAKTKDSRDGEKYLSYAQEIRIEVSGF